MPPGAWASSVSAVPIKNCGAASTENVTLAPFEMAISIGFLADIRTHSLFLCFTQFPKRMQTARHAISEGESISSQVLHTKSRSNSVSLPQA